MDFNDDDLHTSCNDDAYSDETQGDTFLDDDMDGDAQSALASAGWGTDEDYNYTMENDYFDDF